MLVVPQLHLCVSHPEPEENESLAASEQNEAPKAKPAKKGKKAPAGLAALKKQLN